MIQWKVKVILLGRETCDVSFLWISIDFLDFPLKCFGLLRWAGHGGWGAWVGQAGLAGESWIGWAGWGGGSGQNFESARSGRARTRPGIGHNNARQGPEQRQA